MDARLTDGVDGQADGAADENLKPAEAKAAHSPAEEPSRPGSARPPDLPEADGARG